LRRRSSDSITVAAAVAAALSGNTALAQQTAEESQAIEQIVVTGSRIPRADIISNSPVNILDADDFQLSGALEVERLLDTLPQVVGTFGASSNNPGTGTATVNLRGLGAERTLVLINGRRMVAANTNGVVDLNSIPPALIQRVEVVTGGASAVYGSDALAGVVNFILKDNFEGVEFNTQTGISGEADGRRVSFDLTMGTNFDDDRGNVVFYTNYFDRNGFFADARPWGADSYVNAVDADGNAFLRQLAPEDVNAPLTRLSRPELETANSGLTDPFGTPIGPFGIVLTDGGWRAYEANTDQTHTSFDSTMQLPMERWQFSSLGSYDFTENVRVFAEAQFSNVKVSSILSPIPLPSAIIPNFRLDTNNPFMSDDLRDLLAGQLDPNGDLNGVVPINLQRSTRELGQRTSTDDRTVWRVVAGLEGDFRNDMSWEVFYNFGRNQNTTVQGGGLHLLRFQQSLLVDPNDPTQCADPSGPAGGCSVLNLFETGGWTEDNVDFLSIGMVNTANIQSEQLGAGISGNIAELPGGSLGVAFGAEYRSESAFFEPDNLYRTGEGVARAAGLQPTGGKFDVSEVYGEAIVPIVSDLPFAEYIGLEAGIRFSDYSTAGAVTSYKWGGEWVPHGDIRFRGLVQRAVRAPNVIELFRGGDNTAPQARDFCDVSANPSQAEKDFCVLLGVPANAIDTFQQESTQIRAIVGGNPDLEEEVSDTWTLGFVYQPSQVENLNVTVDYYDIQIEDAIAIFGGGLSSTIDACRQDLSLQNPFCVPLTTRGPDGQLRDVPLLNANIAKIQTTGVDFNLNYSFDLPGTMGLLDYSLSGARVFENTFQGSPVINATDCSGFVGGGACSFADPKWRAVQRLTWNYHDFDLSLRHRFIGSVENGRIAAANATGSPIPNVPVLELDSVSYFDLSGNWTPNDRYTVYAIVDNVFDKSPPIIGNTDGVGFVNTDSFTYDVIGRYFTVGFRAHF
jgi:outer membrane receptor protein involved in Fe transport